MIRIATNTPNHAWKQTFISLYDSGSPSDNGYYFRDEVTLISIDNPDVELADSRFPMTQREIDIINHFIFTSENEDKLVHEWTKLYYHRAFDEPHSQIEFLINKLRSGNPIGEAQISMWDKNIDQNKKVSPCTQIIWARIKQGKVELHIHAHSSDVYKKLLMNILEFISLQHYIAKRVELPVGTYYHFIDSGHLHSKDVEAINNLRENFRIESS